MDKVIKFPPDWQSIVGVAVVAILAVAVARRIPFVKKLLVSGA